MQDCSTGQILFHSANAAAVINDAISNLTSGGKILIKAGTYTFTTATIGSSPNFAAIGTTTVANIELYGEGNATVLTEGSNLNAAAVIGVNGPSGWYIHDLQINGARSQQSASGATGWGLDGIWVSGNDETIEHCYVHDDKTFGIVVGGGSNEQILYNWVLNNNANGIQLNPPSEGSVIQGNIVNGASDVGISISGGTTPISSVLCYGNTVENVNLGVSPFGLNTGMDILAGDNGVATSITVSMNQVYGGKVGIDSAPFGGTNLGILISDNAVHSTTSNAIMGSATNGLSISGNLIDISSGYSVQVYSSDADVAISGNQIYGNIADFIDTNTAANVLISGNQLEGTGAYISGASVQFVDNTVTGAGVALNAGTSNSLVTGNYIYTNPSNYQLGLYVDGPLTTVSNNRIVSYSGIYIDSGATYLSVQGNDFRGCSQIFGGIQTQTGLIFLNNKGYNPRGKIVSPFVSSSDTILDSGSAATLVNATTMTVWESPKIITVITGNYTSAYTLVIQIDGTQVLSITNPAANSVYSFQLQPGETFYCQYHTSQTTFVVSGE